MFLTPSERFHPMYVYCALPYAVISRVVGVGCTLRDFAHRCFCFCVSNGGDLLQAGSMRNFSHLRFADTFGN